MSDATGDYKILIDECEHGHKFAKLPDHPKQDGLPRCPYCMAVGLDRCRFERDALQHRLAEVEGVLKPLAAMRLSTEPEISDCVYRSPATEARRRADQIEKRDADILRARSVLSTEKS